MPDSSIPTRSYTVVTDLTKSRYLSWLQCPKRLWLEVHQPERQAELSLAQQRIIQQGTEVGEFARTYFPGGVLIDSGDRQQAITQTQAAMRADVPYIFEASFQWESLYIQCDVLERQNSGLWSAIEVKSATTIKLEYIDDLAFQTYVLKNLEIQLHSTELLNVNSKSCFFPDLQNFFIRTDLTDEVNDCLGTISSQLQQASSTTVQSSCPDVEIGDRCTKPNPCPFKPHCWQAVPEQSIFTIPRLHARKKADLYAQGIVHLQDIPADYPLSDNQKNYVDLATDNRVLIDLQGIQQLLSELQYPIHFLDFETVNPAIPQFEGLKPYESYPFQYSCHILHADGSEDWLDFLHTETTDPRELLANALVNHLHPTGSVVAYSASFEKGVMQRLADRFPYLADRLESAIARLWDQLDVFRHYYRHPGFQGSNSIKKVFPVLCPNHSQYDSLAIRKGDDAQASWLQVVATQDADEKAELAADLREYCKLDTKAMLEIHRVLQANVER